MHFGSNLRASRKSNDMTIEHPIPSDRVTAARKAITENAHKIGITTEYISVLVDSFYDRIRVHETLGPIFNNAIGDNWDMHLAQMKRFWASVAMNAGTYSGSPVEKHRKHNAVIESQHFDLWLDLFKQTLEETAPTPDCVNYFMTRAERIANSLKLSIFGTSGLGPPRYGA